MKQILFNPHINETPAGSFFSGERERESNGKRRENEGDFQRREGEEGSLGVMGEQNEGDVQVRGIKEWEKGRKIGDIFQGEESREDRGREQNKENL